MVSANLQRDEKRTHRRLDRARFFVNERPCGTMSAMLTRTRYAFPRGVPAAPDEATPCLGSLGSGHVHAALPAEMSAMVRRAALPDEGTLPSVGDEEGERLPSALPPVIDAHVHLFPDPMFEAIWRWFERHGWPIRYKLTTPRVIEFLLSRGVERVVALHYAHKPGMARALNAYMADVCRSEPRVVGLATVMPGEEGAAAILEEAFDAGLRGVKLHCHVQGLSADSDVMHEVYEVCARRGKPVVIHAGRQPASSHYKLDTFEICAASRVERALQDHPSLRLCVPHFGADEYDDYERLIRRYDNLWLDTTMMVADYFPLPSPLGVLRARPDRVMYGTDFPNLPYAWDREIKKLTSAGMREEDLALVLGANARSFFAIEEEASS